MNYAGFYGRLATDVNTSTTKDGKPMAWFRLAVPRRKRNPDGSRPADFFNVVAFSGTADLCSKYLAKGRAVIVTGEMQTSRYQKDGQDRESVKLIANEITFTDSGKRAGMPEEQDGQMEGQGLPGADGFTQVETDELPF